MSEWKMGMDGRMHTTVTVNYDVNVRIIDMEDLSGWGITSIQTELETLINDGYEVLTSTATYIIMCKREIARPEPEVDPADTHEDNPRPDVPF